MTVDDLKQAIEAAQPIRPMPDGNYIVPIPRAALRAWLLVSVRQHYYLKRRIERVLRRGSPRGFWTTLLPLDEEAHRLADEIRWLRDMLATPP